MIVNFLYLKTGQANKRKDFEICQYLELIKIAITQ